MQDQPGSKHSHSTEGQDCQRYWLNLSDGVRCLVLEVIPLEYFQDRFVVNFLSKSSLLNPF